MERRTYCVRSLSRSWVGHMANTDIASAAERSLTSQAELVTTLSLAVVGGILAIIVQIRTHNASNGNQRIVLRNTCLMWLAMIAAAIAIALNYVISGMLIQVAPQLFSLAYDASLAFSDQQFGKAPIWAIQAMSLIQFIAFVASIVFGVFFVATNSE